MPLTRRSFLAATVTTSAPLWLRHPAAHAGEAPADAGLTCEISGLAALVRHPHDTRMDVLFVDPTVRHHHLEKHEAVLVARYDDVNWAQTTLRPLRQFADATGYVVMWSLDGLDLRFKDAAASGVQVTGGQPAPAGAPLQRFPNSDEEWGDLNWVPRMDRMAPATKGEVGELFVKDTLPVDSMVRSRIRFTEGTARALKPRDQVFRTTTWTVLDSKTFDQVVADRTEHAVPRWHGRTLLASPLGFACNPTEGSCTQIAFRESADIFWIANLPPGVSQPADPNQSEGTPVLEHIDAFYDLLASPIAESAREIPFQSGTCCAGGGFAPRTPVAGRIPITCGRVMLFAK